MQGRATSFPVGGQKIRAFPALALRNSPAKKPLDDVGAAQGAIYPANRTLGAPSIWRCPSLPYWWVRGLLEMPMNLGVIIRTSMSVLMVVRAAMGLDMSVNMGMD